jgi:hypothetical protein
MLRRTLRRRYWFEVALAVLTGILLILTLITREWIEELFGVDPDGGSGALEWAIVIGLLLITVITVVAALHEWRHAQLATT